MSRGVVALLLLASLSGFTHPEESGNLSAELAEILTRNASMLLQGDSVSLTDIIDASSSLDAASEYLVPGPDYRYLRAVIALDGRLSVASDAAPVRKAYEWAEASLDPGAAANRNDTIPFETRAFLFAKLSLRLREYRAFLEAYGQWPRGHRYDVRLLYAASRSSLHLGLTDEAAALARRGESLNASVDQLAEFEMDLPDSRSAFRAIRVAAGDPEAVETLESALRRWGSGLETALEPWILGGWIDVRNTGRLAELLRPELLAASDLVSSFPGAPAVPAEYRQDLSLVLRAGELAALESFTAGYTGTIRKDSEYDGIFEEQVGFINGRPDSRRVDADQDGWYEWEITYDGGVPVQIRVDEGRLTVNYDEGAFPEILSMVRHSGPVRGEAYIAPGLLKWDPSSGDALFGPLNPPDWKDSDLWRTMTSVTVAVDDPADDEIVEARTLLDAGFPIRALEVRYPRGRRENPSWVRELLYEDGLAVAARRSFRSDPENPARRVWELYERYEDGILVGLAWDPGMTGSPVYLKDWALDTFLNIQVWDVDADGWLDARRFLGPNNRESSRELFVTEADLTDLLPWRAADWWPWE